MVKNLKKSFDFESNDVVATDRKRLVSFVIYIHTYSTSYMTHIYA